MPTYEVITQDPRGERYKTSVLGGVNVIRAFGAEHGRPYRIRGSFDSGESRLQFTDDGRISIGDLTMEWEKFFSKLNPKVIVGSRIVASPVDESGRDVPPEHAYGYMVTGKVVGITR